MKVWMLGYAQSTGGIVPSRGRDATCLAWGMLQQGHGSGKQIVRVGCRGELHRRKAMQKESDYSCVVGKDLVKPPDWDLGHGRLDRAPAWMWNVGTLAPGDIFYATWSIRVNAWQSAYLDASVVAVSENTDPVRLAGAFRLGGSRERIGREHERK
jgi:hypothetical protein